MCRMGCCLHSRSRVGYLSASPHTIIFSPCNNPTHLFVHPSRFFLVISTRSTFRTTLSMFNFKECACGVRDELGREEGDGNCLLANRNISLRLLSGDESGRRFCVIEASINFDKPPSSVALEAWRTTLHFFFVIVCFCYDWHRNDI